jgi:hypothetical protein
MPPLAERFGPRTGRESAGLDSRRATVRAGLEATRDADFEQIGQFSRSRLWRQNVGTGPVYAALEAR